MTFDPVAFGRRMAQTIKEHVAPLRTEIASLAAANAALQQRADALERQLQACTIKGARIDRDGVLFLTLGNGDMQDLGQVTGRDADPREVEALVDQRVERAIAGLELPTPAPVDPASLRPMVAELVEHAVGELPVPRDGRDADPREVEALVDQRVERAIAGLELPRPAPVDPASLRPIVAELVEDRVDRTVEQTVERAIAGLEMPRDGRGIAGTLIDDNGDLVVTYTDGENQRAGRVKGRDGADLEHLAFETPDGRRFTVRARSGAREFVSEFTVPSVIDRGIWQASSAYDVGDGVTFKGSYWIAEAETNARPGTPDSGWRLAVKRGRDGRPDRRQTGHEERV